MKLKSIFKLDSLRIGIILTLVMIYAIHKQPHFLEQLEARAYDMRFRVRGPKPGAPEIVIIQMDEKSVDKLGRWPWPRTDSAPVY